MIHHSYREICIDSNIFDSVGMDGSNAFRCCVFEEIEKEAELAAQQEQEERLRTQWDAMGEEERDLACIRQDEVALKYAAEDAKDPIPNIWPKIESAPHGHQKALARAFKERWQAENKWNVKPKQKKQWKKVQRVKAILGEG